MRTRPGKNFGSDCPSGGPPFVTPGTRPVFTITPVEGGGTELHFRHHGLTPELECIEMCTDGWNTCLASLSELAESGQGSPFGS
jgi:hypothetical protein